MKTLVIRNTKLYFRDKTNIFFSMLSVMLIIALFVLFLGTGNWGGNEVRDSWLMAGVLAVATITTALGAFATMVEDRTSKIAKGFYASPVKRSHITAAYIISPFIVGFIMTILTTIGFGAYLLITGQSMLSAMGLLKLLGLILLSSISGTALMCFIVSLLKSVSSYNTISTIIGTLSGFLMGIYMPIGNLPTPVQTLIMFFPPAHAAKLFRQILMEQPLADAMAYNPDLWDWDLVQQNLGVVFRIGDFEITPIMSIGFLILSGILFFVLSIFNLRRARVK